MVLNNTKSAGGEKPKTVSKNYKLVQLYNAPKGSTLSMSYSCSQYSNYVMFKINPVSDNPKGGAIYDYGKDSTIFASLSLGNIYCLLNGLNDLEKRVNQDPNINNPYMILTRKSYGKTDATSSKFIRIGYSSGTHLDFDLGAPLWYILIGYQDESDNVFKFNHFVFDTEADDEESSYRICTTDSEGNETPELFQVPTNLKRFKNFLIRTIETMEWMAASNNALSEILENHLAGTAASEANGSSAPQQAMAAPAFKTTVLKKGGAPTKPVVKMATGPTAKAVTKPAAYQAVETQFVDDLNEIAEGLVDG